MIIIIIFIHICNLWIILIVFRPSDFKFLTLPIFHWCSLHSRHWSSIERELERRILGKRCTRWEKGNSLLVSSLKNRILLHSGQRLLHRLPLMQCYIVKYLTFFCVPNGYWIKLCFLFMIQEPFCAGWVSCVQL